MMGLRYLLPATNVEVYFDETNKWVFVDWIGDLTLPIVQHACLGIARCFLDHHYPRVLNNNAQVTSLTPEVTAWLASDFLPAMRLTGVEQLAWVVPPALRARTNALTRVDLFPHCTISLFEDMEGAIAWLQQTAPEFSATGHTILARLLADEVKLRTLVDAFAQQLGVGPNGFRAGQPQQTGLASG